MLEADRPLALYMPDAFGKPEGKMGYGVLRYHRNPVACIVDAAHAGQRAADLMPGLREAPIVATLEEARRLGAEVLVLGTAPSGGRVPPSWSADLDRAVALGMCIVNGLHDRLAPRWPKLAPRQWIWDVRQEPADLPIAGGRARDLPNRRVLTVGIDMAIGKMTTGLEILASARRRGIDAGFVATGQIGIVITGDGVALDAIRLDYAAGAIEAAVLACGKHDLVLVEGQGSILHPGSTATLPLMRGSCPTHLVLCHRAGKTHIKNNPHLSIPPLREVIRLYEAIASACGLFPAARVVALAADTSSLRSDDEARAYLAGLERESGLGAHDAVRFGAEGLVDAIMSAPMPELGPSRMEAAAR